MFRYPSERIDPHSADPDQNETQHCIKHTSIVSFSTYPVSNIGLLHFLKKRILRQGIGS